MAAPRATQFIALRNLSRGSSQVRHLHLTGPATYASPVLTQERPVMNIPHDIAGLRAECKKRNISASGSTQELSARLQADHLSSSRAFTTATNPSQTRPTPTVSTPTPTRHFNTSRSLKAVGDSSTIDFAYLPDTFSDDAPEILRVPILPDSYARSSTVTPIAALTDDIPPVMKPEISTMSADAVYLPMSDLSDGHAMNIDFHAMADRMAVSLKELGVKPGAGADEVGGMMKRVWGDLVDDVVKALGAKKPSA